MDLHIVVLHRQRIRPQLQPLIRRHLHLSAAAIAIPRVRQGGATPGRRLQHRRDRRGALQRLRLGEVDAGDRLPLLWSRPETASEAARRLQKSRHLGGVGGWSGATAPNRRDFEFEILEENERCRDPTVRIGFCDPRVTDDGIFLFFEIF